MSCHLLCKFYLLFYLYLNWNANTLYSVTKFNIIQSSLKLALLLFKARNRYFDHIWYSFCIHLKEWEREKGGERNKIKNFEKTIFLQNSPRWIMNKIIMKNEIITTQYRGHNAGKLNRIGLSYLCTSSDYRIISKYSFSCQQRS